MARSYSVADTRAVGSASYPQLSIWQSSAGVSRPRLFEFEISASATPADNTSRIGVARHTTAAPTGGTSLTSSIFPLDFAEPASSLAAMGAATGGCTMSSNLMSIAVNQRATFRWVAAPGKEIVVPVTQYAGICLQSVYQSGAYNLDTVMVWEE